MANVRKAVQEKGKVARVPFGTVRLKTQLSKADDDRFKERGMKPRWFNDADGRLERARAAGYSFVDPEDATSLGQSAIHQGNTDEGSKVSMIAGRGESQLRMYLMEIPIKYWKADQAEKMDHIDQLEQQDPFEQDGQSGISYGSGVKYSH
ncbi:hypothetical protein LCGC14_1453640 [marine sediment metagenome]|uniref:Uncharacterized protein n=1 Tax=marine sediment metagenome TaxID=412755 RepID=A0A0F9MIY4_9ZZZZ